jgi:hypothetical protein
VSAAARWPDQLLVERRLEAPLLDDVEGTIERGLAAVLGGRRWEGNRIAVAVGSRGIDQVPRVVKAVARVVRARGGAPFVVPAMGSHGGATPEGQAAVLRALGVEETAVAAPILSSLEVREVGRTDDGIPVFGAEDALGAAGLILLNRVKPHTDFAGAIGSGLLKMAAIGLGKAEGAFACHRAAARLGYERVIRTVARVQLARLPVVAGVALVEGPRHRLAHCEVLPPSAIEPREPALLAQARAWMPGLPLSDIDVLVVDEIGKNVSGTGMDTNVIGRGVDGKRFGEATPRIAAIYARGLTPESKGNAIGLGLADVVSSRLVRAMDAPATFTNALTALTPATVRVPMHFETDRECLQACLRLALVDDPPSARIVRVRNTLALDRLVVSPACLAELGGRAEVRVVGAPRPLAFDATGDLDAASDLLRLVPSA